jgi:hypothetical protein
MDFNLKPVNRCLKEPVRDVTNGEVTRVSRVYRYSPNSYLPDNDSFKYPPS